jgi:hypothetical protein
MEQTGLEWLWNMLLKGEFINDSEELLRQAKEMEKDRMIQLVQGLKDYTHESHTILGHDEREASEFVDIFYNETYGGNNHLCCTPIGQIKRYVNCIGCNRKPLTYGGNK